jgi:hypothetical protein
MIIQPLSVIYLLIYIRLIKLTFMKNFSSLCFYLYLNIFSYTLGIHEKCLKNWNFIFLQSIQFNPLNIQVDYYAHLFYVSDSGNHRVQAFT